MKSSLYLSLAFLVSACAGPTYHEAALNDFTKANYSAVEQLISSTTVPINKSIPVLVATLVNIDALNSSSRFGRLISEQVSTRLSQQGFNVIEMRIRSDIYIREGSGEMMLSRDVRDLSKNYQAQVVVVGNYALASGYVYLTLKVVTLADNRIIAAVNYALPLTENNLAMLSLQK